MHMSDDAMQQTLTVKVKSRTTGMIRVNKSSGEPNDNSGNFIRMNWMTIPLFLVSVCLFNLSLVQ